MNLITKKLFTISLLMVTAVGVVFSQPNPMNNPTEVAAESLTFTITAANFPTLTGTASTSQVLGSITVSGVQIDLGVKNGSVNNQGALVLEKNASALYNINPLPGTISEIRITLKTGQSNTLYVGSTTRIINSTAGDYSVISLPEGSSLKDSGPNQRWTSVEFPILSLNSNLSYFAILADGGSNTQIESIGLDMTVAEVVANNGQTYSFAIDFLSTTDNKQGQCTAAGLSWSSLETQYNSLNTDQKNVFRTDTTDLQIVAARTRYIYLRTIAPLELNNFASL